ncbi:hypothetical protein SAMN05660831_02692 [Thiohalospira halophila DSM 15071]|uniref:Uncharacterized protein n=1 Tax=Thiohalospira halophila DSM 15071 TaxID=1123397 RepID=A0A1I1WSU3_9GAMM|nr:hypothetical protein [Thiohalospira halophila]SFD96150.1 hypothetical protein SAMN05660831_02692 [Thiohalospira halophila DSM 15071]
MTISKEDSARLLWEQLPDSAREAFEQARLMLGIPLTFQGAIPIADNLAFLQSRIRTLIGAERIAPLWEFVDGICRLPKEVPLQTEPWLTAIEAGKGYKDPLHGCKENYPVWSALWFRHHLDDRDGPRAGQPDAGSGYAWVYQGLQAQYVAGYLRLTSGQREELKSRVEVAGRSIRQLHGPNDKTAEDHDYVLEWLREAIGDPGELFNALVAAKGKLQGTATHSTGYGLGCLAELLRVAHSLSEPPAIEERQSGSRRGDGGREGGARLDANRLWPQHAYYRYFNGKTGHAELVAEGGALEIEEPDEKTHREILDAGLDPREYRGAGETAWVNVKALTDGPEEELVQLAPLASLYAAARGRARQMRMQVQRLPFDRGRVRLAELATLTSAMAADYEAFARAEPTKKKERENRTQTLRMLRVAATALTTGAKPSRLLPKGQFQAIESAKDLPYDYQLAVNLEHRMWVRPYDPPARNPLRAEESGGAIDMRPRVALPDIWSVTANTVAEDQVADWNTHKSATLEAHWQAFLGRHDLSSVRKKWLSFDGLADILPSWWLGLEEGAQLERQMLFRRDCNDPLVSAHLTRLMRGVPVGPHSPGPDAAFARCSTSSTGG